jgi:hypothetical protein
LLDHSRRLLNLIDKPKLSGLRDRALIAVMIFIFAWVSAVVLLRVEVISRMESDGGSA